MTTWAYVYKKGEPQEVKLIRSKIIFRYIYIFGMIRIFYNVLISMVPVS